MAKRDSGRALFTSSIVAMMPGPYQTMYNASKSFIQSFAEGLHNEFLGTGVSVTALMRAPRTPPSFAGRRWKIRRWDGCLFKDDPAKTARKATTR